jgi:hypothetical protein
VAHGSGAEITVTDDLKNPTLIELAVLVGDWNMILSNAASVTSDSPTAVGRMHVQLIERGVAIVMRPAIDQTSDPAA